MRVLIIGIGVIAVLSWLGFELRKSSRDWSWICFGLAGMMAVMLVGAFFGLNL